MTCHFFKPSQKDLVFTVNMGILQRLFHPNMIKKLSYNALGQKYLIMYFFILSENLNSVIAPDQRNFLFTP